VWTRCVPADQVCLARRRPSIGACPLRTSPAERLGPARSSCSLHAARLTTIRLDSSIQDATVPFPLQKRFLLVVSVLRVRLLPIIGGALRTGGGL